MAKREGDGELGSFKGRAATLAVSKDKDDIVVSCEAAGHEPKTQRVVSKTQAAGVVGGVFLDLGITDMITGAMWKYPTDISIVLTPVQANAAAVAPAAAVVPVPASAGAAPAAAAAPTAPRTGQEQFQVSKLARESSCHSEPSPAMIASGPGFESYVVTCSNGDAINVRCDFGACRTLK